MTTDELKDNWKKYAVNINDEIKPLKDCFTLCWGYPDPLHGGTDFLLFDVGGEQGASAYLLKVSEDGDYLISVNPENTEETTVLGKLVLL